MGVWILFWILIAATFAFMIIFLWKLSHKPGMKHLSKKDKQKCTGSTEGRITEKIRMNHSAGAIKATDIIVSYRVDDKDYFLREHLKVHKEPIRIGKLPIGTVDTWSLGRNIEPGMKVYVRYDPEDPNKAYLPDNIGLSVE